MKVINITGAMSITGALYITGGHGHHGGHRYHGAIGSKGARGIMGIMDVMGGHGPHGGISASWRPPTTGASEEGDVPGLRLGSHFGLRGWFPVGLSQPQPWGCRTSILIHSEASLLLPGLHPLLIHSWGSLGKLSPEGESEANRCAFDSGSERPATLFKMLISTSFWL